MAEQRELSGKFTEYIENLEGQVGQLRTTAESQILQAEYLAQQKELFEKYGAKVPLAMQTAQFMIEQIAASYASSSTPLEVPIAGTGSAITVPRARARAATPRGNRVRPSRNYNIASQVKPIMKGIFGREKENVPEDLDSLFNRMYGKHWNSRSITIPLGPGEPYTTRSYMGDLNSDDSYIRGLIAGADKVICRNMRGNTPPDFPFMRRVAAADLVRLYNKIDVIGWDIYDNFMVRNRIRQQQKTS